MRPRAATDNARLVFSFAPGGRVGPVRGEVGGWGEGGELDQIAQARLL
jgi:hypothetical protein